MDTKIIPLPETIEMYDSYIINRMSIDRYARGNGIAVQLLCDDGELFATVSINIGNAPVQPNPEKGEFYLKNWTENAQIAAELLRRKWIEPTGHVHPTGFVQAPMVRFSADLWEKIKAA